MLAYMRPILLCALVAGCLRAGDEYPPPRFADLDERRNWEAAIPRIDAIFRAYALEKNIPGMVWGVVIDNRLAHVGRFGVQDRVSNASMTTDSASRTPTMAPTPASTVAITGNITITNRFNDQEFNCLLTAPQFRCRVVPEHRNQGTGTQQY